MSALRPRNLEEALRALSDPEQGAVAVAGCTDLMVVDHATGRSHKTVVDVLSLPELRGIEVQGGYVDIGALPHPGRSSGHYWCLADPESSHHRWEHRQRISGR